jgi:ATP-dependent RNA helicase RhlE
MIVVKKTDTITTQQGVYYVAQHKKSALLEHIITERKLNNTIVFARTKYSADKLARDLSRSGITAQAFHGDQSRNERARHLSNFLDNSIRVLVSTDQAAHCIAIAALPTVINYELPDSAETYTNRVRHAGNAGQSGVALSLCDREEQGHLKNINRVLRDNLEVIEHPFI